MNKRQVKKALKRMGTNVARRWAYGQSTSFSQMYKTWCKKEKESD